KHVATGLAIAEIPLSVRLAKIMIERDFRDLRTMLANPFESVFVSLSERPSGTARPLVIEPELQVASILPSRWFGRLWRTSQSMQPILSGLRVIDCGTYIAGPAAATIMSDFGADVIKVERPPHGDPYRMLYKLPGMPLSSIDYNSILDSRNKKSLALDLGDACGREALLKLIESADVFVTNYQPQLVKKFGLTF